MAVIQAGLDGLLEDALNRETIGDVRRRMIPKSSRRADITSIMRSAKESLLGLDAPIGRDASTESSPHVIAADRLLHQTPTSQHSHYSLRLITQDVIH
jgi:hypothetical protein